MPTYDRESKFYEGLCDRIIYWLQFITHLLIVHMHYYSVHKHILYQFTIVYGEHRSYRFLILYNLVKSVNPAQNQS